MYYKGNEKWVLEVVRLNYSKAERIVKRYSWAIERIDPSIIEESYIAKRRIQISS